MPELSDSAFTKKEKQQAAVVGAGAVVGGTGLVAGGLPGAKSDFSSVLNTKPPRGKTKVKRAVTSVTGKAGAVKAAPGGILGFRTSAHRGGLYGFTQDKIANDAKGAKNASEAFFQGRNEGKIAPEEKILRHMRGAKRVSGAALVGGAGAVGYGVRRSQEPDLVKKSQRKTDQYNSTLVGVGGAGAAVSHGADRVLRGQEKAWSRAASSSVDDAGKLVPAIAGRQGQRMSLRQMNKYKTKNPGKEFPKSMSPKISDGEIKRNPKLLAGVDNDTARKAGEYRGAAAQQRHFAEVYGNTAKVVRRFRTPSAIVAGAGAGGLIAADKKDKVKKSAFGVEHVSKLDKPKKKPVMSDTELRHRKKVQGAISRTTSTLGLGGVTVGGAAIAASKRPGSLKYIRKVPGFKNATSESLKEKGLYTSLASGGIGGVGGYNFAAYTDAESRKRKPVAKRNVSAFGVIHD